jgi:hypothetical protein
LGADTNVDRHVKRSVTLFDFNYNYIMSTNVNATFKIPNSTKIHSKIPEPFLTYRQMDEPTD